MKYGYKAINYFLLLFRLEIIILCVKSRAAAGPGTGAGGNELNNMKNALALRYHHVYDVGTINQPHASAKRQRSPRKLGRSVGRKSGTGSASGWGWACRWGRTINVSLLIKCAIYNHHRRPRRRSLKLSVRLRLKFRRDFNPVCSFRYFNN